MKGVTLDAGGLIGFERDDRRVVPVVQRAILEGLGITIPATVLAQVIRNPARQVILTKLLEHHATRVATLGVDDAIQVGRVLAVSGTKDIADAHVVVCARGSGHDVITSDPGDIRRLAPELRLIPV